MPFILHCPSCDKEYNLPDAQQGKRVRCKDCGHTFTAQPKAADPTEEGGTEGILSSRSSGPERSGTSRSSQRDRDEEAPERDERPRKPRKPIRKSDDSGMALLYVLL